MNVCHNNTTLTLNITCLCYLNNSIFSSNIDFLLTSVSVSTASGAMCQKKIKNCIWENQPVGEKNKFLFYCFVAFYVEGGCRRPNLKPIRRFVMGYAVNIIIVQRLLALYKSL